MMNKNISPLYIFVNSQINVLGIRNLKKVNIEKALHVIDEIIGNCCNPKKFPPTNNWFLKTFYELLRLMDFPREIPKLKKVRHLLKKKLDCCDNGEGI